jgi:iron complex transport system substrate-binding protein
MTKTSTMAEIKAGTKFISSPYPRPGSCPRRRLGPAVTVIVALGVFLSLVAEYSQGVNPVFLRSPLFPDTTLGEENAFPKHIHNSDGSETVIAKLPERIVSSVLAVDEILAEIVSPSRIAGVTKAVDNPALFAYPGVIPQSAVRHHGGIEEILRLEPDLVFVANYSREATVRFLLSLHIPVVKLGQYSSIADVMRNVREVGSAVGAGERAEMLVQDMERRLAHVQAQVADLAKRRVLYYSEGGITAGRATVIDEAIALAGGTNVASIAGLSGEVEIPLELAVSLSPEVIILPGWKKDVSSPMAEKLASDVRWQDVPAVKNGEVHTVRSSVLTTLSHRIAGGVEELARLIHPEATVLSARR